MDVHVQNEQLKILEGACVGDKANHIMIFLVTFFFFKVIIDCV